MAGALFYAGLALTLEPSVAVTLAACMLDLQPDDPQRRYIDRLALGLSLLNHRAASRRALFLRR